MLEMRYVGRGVGTRAAAGQARRDRCWRRPARACWEDWKGTQVKLINEYRLNVTDPVHFDRLMTEMTAFLSLRGDGAAAD